MLEIPLLLQPRLAFFHRYFSTLNHPLVDAVQTLLLVSDFAQRNVVILQLLLSRDDCKLPIFRAGYEALVKGLNAESEIHFGQALRQFRHYHFLRLLLRELAGLASSEETMASWSDCADAIILRTLAFCSQELSKRFGEPCEESGQAANLYVLAMGKLGGRELNYSSDIDLIMAYSGAGFTNGQQSIPNEQFYTKVVQQFIQLLQNITAEGFVFRVDLRLRPNGESGALVSSLAALETYYQEQGRDWERYAMVKSRLINSPKHTLNPWFNRLITPFIYRRYVDFSVIESLRSMKTMIEREVQLNPSLNDIKRGLGGIREVEFIIQNIQLIRGGRIPELRVQNAVAALKVIGEQKLLPRSEVLKNTYLFLRKIENCLQSENDQQTHTLPSDPQKAAQIAYAMGFDSWQILNDKLQQARHFISNMFHAVLRVVDEEEDDKRLLANQLTTLWQGHVEQTMAVNLLRSLGYDEAERCYQLIHAFRHAPRCRRLKQAARLRLDRFMVLLLGELMVVSQSATVLLQVIRLLENIVGRSAYLALLTENPHTLKELLYWFSKSPFITALIVEHPFLLEILLQPEERFVASSRSKLQYQLDNQLAHCHEMELQEEVLRQFKLYNWLRGARAELGGLVDAVKVGRFLADVAFVIVDKVVDLACQQLSIRYPDILSIKSQFAIIAYGKLGSREMNYNSDLDLVFVHYTKSSNENLIIRWTQKIIHMLTVRSQSGILYQVDTRLRPSGEAGLLVSNLDAFLNYQKTQAWTWEHQALIRAQILLGSQKARRFFYRLKREVLLQKRKKSIIRNDVQSIREKIVQHLTSNEIKHAPGGLLDLEFLVQFLVLANPGDHYSRSTSTLTLLKQLAIKRVISLTQFKLLENAFKHYHLLLHQQLLNPSNVGDWKNEQKCVLALSRLLYGIRY